MYIIFLFFTQVGAIRTKIPNIWSVKCILATQHAYQPTALPPRYCHERRCVWKFYNENFKSTVNFG